MEEYEKEGKQEERRKGGLPQGQQQPERSE
jgi:hypothetical protein